MRPIDADALEPSEMIQPLGNGRYEYVRIVYMDDIDAMPTIKLEQNNDAIWDALSTVYNMSSVPEEAKSIIGDVMLSLEDPERKTGRWIKAEGSYVTPGGDEVWQCSECGKGIHVYGIEHGTYGADISDGQWVSCPNCGCLMNEELTNV